MSHATPPPRRRAGLSAAAGQEFSLNDAVGGVRGVVESVLPSLLFLVAFLVTHELRPALYLAAGTAAVMALARVVTGSSPMQAIAGLVGVLFCAWNSNRTGDARGYYTPGFWINAGYGLAMLISLIPLPGRTLRSGTRLSAGSYPLVGLIVGPLQGEGLAWRDNPPRRRAFTMATLVFVCLFGLRLAVQLPLYFTDRVALLGTARLAMGIPLMALAVWLTWLLVREPSVRSDATGG